MFEISTIYLSFLVIGNDLINTVLLTFIILKNSTKNTDIITKNATNIGDILATDSIIFASPILLIKFDNAIYSTNIKYRNIIPYNNIFPIFFFFKGFLALYAFVTAPKLFLIINAILLKFILCLLTIINHFKE